MTHITHDTGRASVKAGDTAYNMYMYMYMYLYMSWVVSHCPCFTVHSRSECIASVNAGRQTTVNKYPFSPTPVLVYIPYHYRWISTLTRQHCCRGRHTLTEHRRRSRSRLTSQPGPRPSTIPPRWPGNLCNVHCDIGNATLSLFIYKLCNYNIGNAMQR